MARKVVSLVLFLAFSNFLMGCSYEETVPQASIAPENERIIGATLISGERVLFDHAQVVRYEPTTAGFRGRTELGRLAFVSLADVLELRSFRPLVAVGKTVRTERIAEVVKWDRTLVTFDSAGARIDTSDGRLRGRSVQDGRVSFTSAEILEFRTTWSQKLKVGDCSNPTRPCFVAEVIMRNGTVVTFDHQGASYTITPGRLVGRTLEGDTRTIVLDSVLAVDVRRFDAGLTIVAVLAISAAVAAAAYAIALATKQSCPFVYSWNGTRYQFDAEPLGGAISGGMERTDFSRLEHLVPRNGEYRLLVRNEVPETQYLDEMSLVVVDHEAGTTIIPDLNGHLTCSRSPVAPSRVIDERGNDLSRFLSARDDIAWQTNMTPVLMSDTTPQRHHITITYPKPATASRAMLLTHAGTTSWGSNMIRKMVEYHGDSTEAWLGQLRDGTTEFMELQAFNIREELYYLKAWVLEPGGWKDRAVIRGGGPLMNEDRVYALDISHVIGDSLVLRIDPPAGFWVIDYLGVEYNASVSATVRKVQVKSATDGGGRNIASSLRQRDGVYYSMPLVGDWTALTFDVPVSDDRLQRSVFLQSSGYYTLHPSPGRTGDPSLLRQIATIPGSITSVSMKEYRSWVAQVAQSH